MGTTMKRVRLDKVPLTISGRGFRITNIESPTIPESYRCNQCGNEIVVQKPELIEDADLIQLLKLLSLGIPGPKCTMQDSVNAFDFIQQINASEDGYLCVTDGIHTWLKKIVNEYGPQVYGVNVVAIRDALDNFERAQEKSAK